MCTVLDFSETRDVDFDQTSSFCISFCYTPYLMVGGSERGLTIKWDVFVLVRSWDRIVEICQLQIHFAKIGSLSQTKK